MGSKVEVVGGGGEAELHAWHEGRHRDEDKLHCKDESTQSTIYSSRLPMANQAPVITGSMRDRQIDTRADESRASSMWGVAHSLH